jgi:lysozyme family protein
VTSFSPEFLSAFERLLGHEGGFQRDQADDGNWTGGREGVGELRGTKFGISAASYPTLNIEAISLTDARGIYWRDYWLRVRCDEFDGEIAFGLFDAAVHHGPGNAVRFMQRALGVLDDGRWGPMTEAAFEQAVQRPQALACRFNGARLDFMTRSRRWDRFGAGWSRRVAENLLAIPAAPEPCSEPRTRR